MSQLHRKHKKLGSCFAGCVGLRALSTFEKFGSVTSKTMPEHQALEVNIWISMNLPWSRVFKPSQLVSGIVSIIVMTSTWFCFCSSFFARQLWHCTHSSYFQLLPPARPFPNTAGLPATKNHIDGLDLVLLRTGMPTSKVSCYPIIQSFVGLGSGQVWNDLATLFMSLSSWVKPVSKRDCQWVYHSPKETQASNIQNLSEFWIPDRINKMFAQVNWWCHGWCSLSTLTTLITLHMISFPVILLVKQLPRRNVT